MVFTNRQGSETTFSRQTSPDAPHPSNNAATSYQESLMEFTVADPSVIVGMAARVPGASNISQLWKILAEKRDLQRKIPEDRFNVDAYYHPNSSNKGTVGPPWLY